MNVRISFAEANFTVEDMYVWISCTMCSSQAAACILLCRHSGAVWPYECLFHLDHRLAECSQRLLAFHWCNSADNTHSSSGTYLPVRRL